MARSRVIERLTLRLSPETKKRALELYHLGRAMEKWRNWDQAMQILVELGRMYLEDRVQPRPRLVL